ncbi:DUF6969 family protein [Polynucleobacter antarcticus]|uniref:DUF6969 domain-containing protein n=2 Tax=Polynucleobacter antarcticus TaxID=1743162 RepID=A0A6M9PST9_9BURK|nr:hypothetical protein DCO16_05275 [Polynucleobacter antarcticus]
MLMKSTLCLSAQEILNIYERYAKKGVTLSEVALCGAKEFIELTHYPKNDVVDLVSGYEFYYHAHPTSSTASREHGHFHLFQRQKNQTFIHLIAISLNPQGLPVRLFTCNQWVTGETMVESSKVIESLKDFDLEVKGRFGPIARWVSAMTTLYFYEMSTLIHARDQKLIDLEPAFDSRSQLLESKQNHELTQCDIELMTNLSQHLTITNY